MRQIKFRGSDCRGNLFFGSYDEPSGTIDDFDYAASYAVEPETVAQLVGFDSAGKEIYEGDIVIDQSGIEWKAILYPSLVLPSESGPDNLTVFGEGVTLKED